MEYTTKNAKETFDLGEKIGNYLKSSAYKRGEGILCLYGSLGSGKTVFVQGVAKGLGINCVIPSPTFIIVRRYDLPKKDNFYFLHIDLYRVKKKEEILTLGLTDFLTDSCFICCIEWADRLKDLLPLQRIDVYFQSFFANSRKITIKLINLKNSKIFHQL